jgi:hypothetical protein
MEFDFGAVLASIFLHFSAIFVTGNSQFPKYLSCAWLKQLLDESCTNI